MSWVIVPAQSRPSTQMLSVKNVSPFARCAGCRAAIWTEDAGLGVLPRVSHDRDALLRRPRRG